ncbi:MAG: diaminopimelate decarboxylase [Chloroflexota bacterium]|jgi:diaminopimelate decarboxylase|nr:diaminopimelate decarboxylase [Chloroflexota bacterium]
MPAAPGSTLFPDTYAVDDDGRMSIGGCILGALAAEYGTPLYVYDEATIRNRVAEYQEALRASYPGESLVLYAGKAFLSIQLARLVAETGAGLDLVSGGELHLARAAGFPMERVFFPGNNKSAEEVAMAADAGIGALVVDSELEMELLGRLPPATRVRSTLRVSPGIKPDTHSFIATGQLDSKFGFPVETGQALRALRALLDVPQAKVVGVHCHIGSQVFDLAAYPAAVERVLDFLVTARDELGFVATELSMGGGLGIAYTRADAPPSPTEFVHVVADAVNEGCSQRGLQLPRLLLEPGRSVVGPAAVAVYTVGAIKEIPGVRTYVAVDGGMGDNIRPKLYDAVYEAFKVNDANAEATETVTVAGRYCESTDILVKDARVPPLATGDLLAMPAAGAYSLAMASNYNYNLRPAVVMVRDGAARLIRRRETYDDLLATEV